GRLGAASMTHMLNANRSHTQTKNHTHRGCRWIAAVGGRLRPAPIPTFPRKRGRGAAPGWCGVTPRAATVLRRGTMRFARPDGPSPACCRGGPTSGHCKGRFPLGGRARATPSVHVQHFWDPFLHVEHSRAPLPCLWGAGALPCMWSTPGAPSHACGVLLGPPPPLAG